MMIFIVGAVWLELGLFGGVNLVLRRFPLWVISF
jgi:hypothetical protein